MTKDKAEKVAIRARMAKTGERYTTARHFLLDHHLSSEPSPDSTSEASIDPVSSPEPSDGGVMALPPRVANPGMSDGAILRGTGKFWDEWFVILDAWGGIDRTHTEIARYLCDAHSVDGWWAQGVSVGYERARGMRARHQQPDGYSISASKTIAVPVERVFAAFGEEFLRDQWLETGTLRQRTSAPHRSARFDVMLPHGTDTRIEVYFTVKGEAKARVSIQHSKLAGPDELEPWRAFWKDRLNRLASLLAAEYGAAQATHRD